MKNFNIGNFSSTTFVKGKSDDSPKEDQSDILISDVRRVLCNRKKCCIEKGSKRCDLCSQADRQVQAFPSNVE